jgi:plasmid stabilization system protein ParE
MWTDEALGELEAIRDYIAESDAHAAERVRIELSAAGESLDQFPHRGAQVRGTGLRRIFRWEYVIRYRVIEEDDVVLIVSVRHGRRRPTRV